MQSPDTQRQSLQQLVASIKAWSGFIADVARVEVIEHGAGWRVSLQPFASGACPLEIILDATGEHCDLTVGRQTYERWPLPSLDTLLPLLEAVSEGNVLTRRVRSAVTGLDLGVFTEIHLADGRRLGTTQLPQANGLATSATESRVTHYLPYRRPGRGG